MKKDIATPEEIEIYRRAANAAEAAHHCNVCYFGLTDYQMEFTKFVLNSYMQGIGDPIVANVDVIKVDPLMILRTMQLARARMNERGHATLNRICHLIEVGIEIDKAEKGEISRHMPEYISVQGRLNIHLLFQSIIAVWVQNRYTDQELTLIQKRVAIWCGENFAHLLPPHQRPKSRDGQRVIFSNIHSMRKALDVMHESGPSCHLFATMPKSSGQIITGGPSIA